MFSVIALLPESHELTFCWSSSSNHFLSSSKMIWRCYRPILGMSSNWRRRNIWFFVILNSSKYFGWKFKIFSAAFPINIYIVTANLTQIFSTKPKLKAKNLLQQSRWINLSILLCIINYNSSMNFIKEFK